MYGKALAFLFVASLLSMILCNGEQKICDEKGSCHHENFSNFNKLTCDGDSSCHNITIRNVNIVECKGEYSCQNIINMFNISQMFCQGEQSCRYNQFASIHDILRCGSSYETTSNDGEGMLNYLRTYCIKRLI